MAKKTFACPACGWTVSTPHGDNDLVEAVQWHGNKTHPDMPMTREQIIGMAKTE